MLQVLDEVRLTVPTDTDNPFLLGPFRPTGREWLADTGDLQVIGEIPRDLHGVYVRNSHTQVHDPMGIYHPFDGDGMLAAVHFEDGRATFRNRFVRTTGFLAEQAAGRSLWPGLLQPQLGTRRGWGAIGAMKDNAGTDVHHHAGRLLATMSQGSEPWRLDPITLETLGPDADWARAIPDGVSAHYKIDVRTAEMMFFNYPERWPYMHYGVIDRENRRVHYVPIELPGPPGSRATRPTGCRRRCARRSAPPRCASGSRRPVSPSGRCRPIASPTSWAASSSRSAGPGATRRSCWSDAAGDLTPVIPATPAGAIIVG